jgi:hypothetical protein
MSELAERLRLGVIWLLGAAIACSMAVKLWPYVHVVPTVQAQGNTKTLITDRLYRTDPIEVVKVLGAGKEAKVGTPTEPDLQFFPLYISMESPRSSAAGGTRSAYWLQSDDNWLKTLLLVLRNRTAKRINLVGISVSFPEAGGGPHPPSMRGGGDFFFGQLPANVAYSPSGQPLRPSSREPISFDPGQEMTFALADRGDDLALTGLIEHAQPLSATSQCLVGFFVVLDDGVKWHHRRYFEPDPQHPGQFVELGGGYFPGPMPRSPNFGAHFKIHQ